jgi:uncharacterized protein (UPF0332 family)
LQPSDLLRQARVLARRSPKRPQQCDLKRAVSAAYYAMFHQLCHTCADALVGSTQRCRKTRAWRQVYRAVDHGFAAQQFRRTAVMKRFPAGLQTFAQQFVRLQAERHRADYDPVIRYTRKPALAIIDDAESAIRAFKAEPLSDRRAFAVWAVLKHRD